MEFEQFPYDVGCWLLLYGKPPKSNENNIIQIELQIVVRTWDLGKNANKYKDKSMPGFEYSEKAKETFLNIGIELHNNFPDSYIVFADEYNDDVVLKILNNKNSSEKWICDYYEFVIVPKSDKRQYITNGKVIETDKSKIFISKYFLPEEKNLYNIINKYM